MDKSKQFKGQVQSAIDRTKLIAINNEIALHAKRKELDAAMALFNSAISQGIANSHTYAAAVNANIRCGSLAGAESVMAEMTANGRRKDVIICTTLMKGYCGEGELQKAMKLLEEMYTSKPVILPNVRTINTLLRGCVQAGDMESADMILNKATKEYKIALDVSSWEYLVVLFSQGLRLDKVLPIVGRLKSDQSMRSGMANMNVNIARAAALLGEWKTCRKSLSAARALLDEVAAVDSAATSITDTSAEKKLTTGGKRAWKSGGAHGEGVDEADSRRLQSLELFQQHSKEEMRAEIAIMEQFVDRMQRAASQSSAFAYLHGYFLRMFSFSSEGQEAARVVYPTDDLLQLSDANRAVLQELLHNVDVTFGLGAVVKNITGQSFVGALNGYKQPEAVSKSSKKTKIVPPPPAAPTPASEEVFAGMQSLRSDLLRQIDDHGKIDFAQVFRRSGDTAGVSPPALKMEICSGAGEWAVAQACNDRQSSWVTMELRHDRVYQTFTRAAFAGADNMCILGGDAMKILPHRIATGVVDVLFVNHPEPPQQTGGQESQGKHLLTPAFFLEASRVLKDEGGLFTIVTDNLWYGKFLIRSIATMMQAENLGFHLRSLTLAEKGPSDQWAVQESTPGGDVHLFVGRPGPVAGHVVDASSYFDRLWKRGKLVERYFIVLKKEQTSPELLRGLASACSRVRTNKSHEASNKSNKKEHNVAKLSHGKKKATFTGENNRAQKKPRL